MGLYEQIQEATQAINKLSGFKPTTGLITGTGLGELSREMEVHARIPYADIPHFAQSTVEGHAGELLLGYLNNHPIAVLSGRFHYYEGWNMQEITFPVRVLKYLGVSQLIVTNVSGGINPHLNAGDIVVVKDHIYLFPDNPLRGPNDERIGPRFPDLSVVYDPEMRKAIVKIAAAHHISAIEGIYSALPGPNLETPAEYAMLRNLGSDCTGMSSLPEVLAARHMNLPVLLLSLVVNVAFPPSRIRETTLEEVIQVANEAAPKLRNLITEFLRLP